MSNPHDELAEMAQNPTGRDAEARVARRIDPWEGFSERLAQSGIIMSAAARRAEQEKWEALQRNMDEYEASMALEKAQEVLSEGNPVGLSKQDVLECIDYFFEKLAGVSIKHDRYTAAYDVRVE
jgi:hypothetical protein